MCNYSSNQFHVEESSGYNLCKFGVHWINNKDLVTMEALLFDPPSYIIGGHKIWSNYESVIF